MDLYSLRANVKKLGSQQHKIGVKVDTDISFLNTIMNVAIFYMIIRKDDYSKALMESWIV